jgi:asparagine N-glycosylation enzyme membrane subunit Stt3
MIRFWFLWALVTTGSFVWLFLSEKVEKRNFKNIAVKTLISGIVALILIIAAMQINQLSGI